MRRIRTIKPEFFSDEKLAALSAIDRLVYIGLWSIADDEGRLLDNTKLIDGQIFPLTDESSRESLETLAKLDRIRRYCTANGQRVIQILRWTDHQKIDKPSKSRLPANDPQVATDESPGDASSDSREGVAKASPEPRSWTLDHGPSTVDQRPPTTDNAAAVALCQRLASAVNGVLPRKPIDAAKAYNISAASTILAITTDGELIERVVRDAARKIPAGGVHSLGWFVEAIRRAVAGRSDEPPAAAAGGWNPHMI
jgi:hypothetical protein